MDPQLAGIPVAGFGLTPESSIQSPGLPAELGARAEDTGKGNPSWVPVFASRLSGLMVPILKQFLACTSHFLLKIQVIFSSALPPQSPPPIIHLIESQGEKVLFRAKLKFKSHTSGQPQCQ